MLFSVIKRFFTQSSFIYCELHHKTLFIALLQKTKGAYRFSSYISYELALSDFDENTIHNPTIIATYIQKFLSDLTLKKAQFIVSCPLIKNTSEEKKQLLLLQIRLIFCKTGASIHRIVSEPYRNKKEVPMTISAPHRSFSFHAPLALSFFVISLSSLFFLHHIQQKQLTILKKEELKLSEEKEELKDKLHALHALETMHNSMHNNFETIKRIACKQKNSIPQVLHAVAHCVEEKTYISRIRIHHPEKGDQTIVQTKKLKKFHHITLTAQTESPDEMTTLLTKLSKNPLFHNLFLQSFKKNQPQAHEDPRTPLPSYTFVLNGQLQS